MTFLVVHLSSNDFPCCTVVVPRLDICLHFLPHYTTPLAPLHHSSWHLGAQLLLSGQFTKHTRASQSELFAKLQSMAAFGWWAPNHSELKGASLLPLFAICKCSRMTWPARCGMRRKAVYCHCQPIALWNHGTQTLGIWDMTRTLCGWRSNARCPTEAM